MMDQVLQITSWVLLLAGSFFCLVGGIGTLRFPDFYTRMHAASLTDTLGATLMLFGLMIIAGPTLITVKLVMIGVFLLVTSPTSSHALVKAAAATNVRWPTIDSAEEVLAQTGEAAEDDA